MVRENRKDLVTKTDEALFKSDLVAFEVRIKVWLTGTMLASAAVAASVALFVQRLIG